MGEMRGRSGERSCRGTICLGANPLRHETTHQQETTEIIAMTATATATMTEAMGARRRILRGSGSVVRFRRREFASPVQSGHVGVVHRRL